MDAETLALTLSIIRERTEGDPDAYAAAVERLKAELEGGDDDG